MQAVLSNPQLLEQVVASNPRLASDPQAMGRTLFSLSPSLRRLPTIAMLRDPNFIRMLANPEMIRQAM